MTLSFSTLPFGFQGCRSQEINTNSNMLELVEVFLSAAATASLKSATTQRLRTVQDKSADG